MHFPPLKDFRIFCDWLPIRAPISKEMKLVNFFFALLSLPNVNHGGASFSLEGIHCNIICALRKCLATGWISW